MKKLLIICLVVHIAATLQAQKVASCDKWLTDFIQVAPKVTDGTCLTKYVLGKLQADTLLKAEGTCMVGLQIYVNCRGEFSYEKVNYPNNSKLQTQCNDLLQATETIMNGLNLLSPGAINGHKKDFVFKLVVHVTRNGKPKAELLF